MRECGTRNTCEKCPLKFNSVDIADNGDGSLVRRLGIIAESATYADPSIIEQRIADELAEQELDTPNNRQLTLRASQTRLYEQC